MAVAKIPRPSEPKVARATPPARSTRNTKAIKLIVATVGRISETGPVGVTVRATANRLNDVATRNLRPSRTRSRSSSSKGRSLLGSWIV